MALDRRAGTRAEPDRFRFRNKISDRQYEAAFADHDAVSSTLGSEDLRRKGVLRDRCAQPHHGTHDNVEVERIIREPRLLVRRDLPIAHGWHSRNPLAATTGHLW